MPFVIGIDAGGTKTVGLLADESGKVLSRSISGGANLLVKGELAVEKVLFDVIESLEAPEPLAALCLGIAGVGQPGADQVIRDVLRRLGRREPLLDLDAARGLFKDPRHAIGRSVMYNLKQRAVRRWR